MAAPKVSASGYFKGLKPSAAGGYPTGTTAGSGQAGAPVHDGTVITDKFKIGSTTPDEIRYGSIYIPTVYRGSTVVWHKPQLAYVAGLAGKFFNGSWRSTIANGNIGTLPLTTNNDSSNVTGTTGLPSADHRYGVNLFTSITFGNGIGDNYGFIAIGYFDPPASGTYTIYTSSDDGSGVWIGDLALPGATRTAANATVDNNLGGGQADTERSGTISLNAGTSYPIRIVHEEATGGDNLTFSWAGGGVSKTTALGAYFKTPVTPGTTTLTGNFDP
jgi:hypothetical protein